MDIQARKLNFIQEFLRITDEKLIARLEHLLHNERRKETERDLSPMSAEEFDQMIDQSEKDVETGRVNEARDLLKKVDTWK
ncbi:MAG: hypothetical protein K0B37_15885 [Bacteroidales bacterium]|nr:hypothetical protein [Bacteroidales bacterium]